MFTYIFQSTAVECLLTALTNIEKSGIVSQWMQNVGLAFIAILIPMGIFIFSNSGNEEETVGWDKLVIFSEVIPPGKLLLAIASIFVSPLFWSTDLVIGRWLALGLLGLGAVTVIMFLWRAFLWIKDIEKSNEYDKSSYRTRMRRKFLSSNFGLNEKEKVWSITWGKEIRNVLMERDLLKIFINHLNKLIDIGEIARFGSTLTRFVNSLEKRALYDWIIFGDFFESILEWHHRFPQTTVSESGSDKASLMRHEINASLQRGVENIVEVALGKRLAYLLFKKLKEHSEGKSDKYLKRFFSASVCRPFFDSVTDSSESWDIWNHYFPEKWKITSATLKDEKNIMARIWLDSYFRWAQSRFWKGEGFDGALSDVTQELFSEVDPITWSKVLYMRMLPHPKGQRMGALIEVQQSFGLVGRMRVSGFTDEKDLERQFNERMNQEHKNTLEMAHNLFAGYFTGKRIDEMLEELDELEYEKGSREDRRRLSFRTLLKDMKERSFKTE